jgi:hypothetical protein
MGLDEIPTWITYLFNLFISTSTIPNQWKQARISPIPKVFPPISITPVFTQAMEGTVVHRFLYPAFLSPPPTQSFGDQFAFRPTGSTTAALIFIISTITNITSSPPLLEIDRVTSQDP